MTERLKVVLTDEAVACILRETHDPMLDAAEPSIAQFVIARAAAQKVLDVTFAGVEIDKEDISGYQGTLTQWRLLTARVSRDLQHSNEN